ASDSALLRALKHTYYAIARGTGLQEIAELDVPHRSLGPAHADGEAFDAGIVEAIVCEARIENLYGRVWVAIGRLPRGQGAGRGCGCQGADAAGEHVTS